MMQRLDDHPTTILRPGRPLRRRTFLKATAAMGLAVGLGALSWRHLAAPMRLDLRPGQSAGVDRIADLAAELGYDLEAISGFVTEAIRYEPYAGSLRGAGGTLAARAGNSVDQAALLAALLDASLIPYRFVAGRLDDEAAKTLLATVDTDEEAAREHVATALQGTLPAGVGAPADSGAAGDGANVDSDGAAVEAWVDSELRETVSLLSSVLEREGLVLPSSFSDLPPREQDQHMWLQVAQGAEWVDIDPVRTSGSALPSSSLTETFDTLPEELRHRVELAIRGETLTEAGIEESDLLRVWAYADELAGLPIAFLNASPGGVEELSEAVSPVAGVTTYAPTLVIGGQAFSGRPIRFGRPGALEGDDLLEGGSLFDGAGAAGETTGEWLEVTLTSPDREPLTARRVVFDRFGPQARASDTLGMETLSEPEQLETEDGTREVVPALSSMWLAVDVGLPPADAPSLRPSDGAVEASAVYAQALQLLRGTGDPTFAVPLGVRSFVDAPNVAAYVVGSRPAADGETLIEAGLDILHRSRGTLPAGSRPAALPPAAVTGVLDHVIERVLGGELPGVREPDDTAPTSVGAVFRAALDEGVGLTVLRTADDARRLDYPAGAISLLSEDLKDGSFAVAPERAVKIGIEDRLGWWLVDPTDGRVADRMDDGRGSDSIGYAVTLTPGQLAQQTLLKELAQRCLVGSLAAFATVIGVAVTGLAGSQGYGWGSAALAAASAGQAASASYYLRFCVRAAAL